MLLRRRDLAFASTRQASTGSFASTSTTTTESRSRSSTEPRELRFKFKYPCGLKQEDVRVRLCADERLSVTVASGDLAADGGESFHEYIYRREHGQQGDPASTASAKNGCASSSCQQATLYDRQRAWSQHVLPTFLVRGAKPGAIRSNARCMGTGCTRQILTWLWENFDFDTIVDPFCGAGTVLATAESVGFTRTVGVDISKKRLRQAERLKLRVDYHKEGDAKRTRDEKQFQIQQRPVAPAIAEEPDVDAADTVEIGGHPIVITDKHSSTVVLHEQLLCPFPEKRIQSNEAPSSQEHLALGGS
ncbi:unnamed protein product [Amoebophrya sp. A25]|nr:unnamed protein product [Amoebophrya sp. A25]|eukprot:GSA25T00010017001.1